MKWVDLKLVADDGEILGEVNLRSVWDPKAGWIASIGLGWSKRFIDKESAMKALERKVQQS